MSQLSPKPIIAHVVQTWRVPPGMTIALVEDVEKAVWIVESCPAGTHFWTVEQARHLTKRGKSHHAIQAAVLAANGLHRAPEPAKSEERPLRVAIHRSEGCVSRQDKRSASTTRAQKHVAKPQAKELLAR